MQDHKRQFSVFAGAELIATIERNQGEQLADLAALCLVCGGAQSVHTGVPVPDMPKAGGSLYRESHVQGSLRSGRNRRRGGRLKDSKIAKRADHRCRRVEHALVVSLVSGRCDREYGKGKKATPALSYEGTLCTILFLIQREMQSPADTLATGDPGDETQRRFRYQAAYGALVCLQLVDDDHGHQEIFCEHYEDILIHTIAAKWIGVQVKTREPRFGPFKSNDEPVLNAIERFVLLDRDFPGQFEAFVLVANCDFWRAAETAKNLDYVIAFLREKPRATLPRPIGDIVTKLYERCKCRKKNVISAIAKIRLEGNVPKFEDITVAVACGIGQIPQFRDRMFPELLSAASALINSVLERSALTCDQPIRTHIVFSSDPQDEHVKETISHKRVTADLVLSVLHQSLSTAAGLRTAMPGSLPSEAFGHHLLEEKMSAGGISFPSIDAAKDHLRSAEYLLQQWLHKLGPEAARMRYEQLTVIVKTHCTEAYDAHYSKIALFGQPMLNDLRQRLKSIVQSDLGIFDARYEHLLGVASIATQECTIWWSERFKISEGEP